MYWKSDMSARLSFQIVRTVRHGNKIGWPAFVNQQGHKLERKHKDYGKVAMLHKYSRNLNGYDRTTESAISPGGFADRFLGFLSRRMVVAGSVTVRVPAA
jgi:hypothetical protein